MSQDCRADAPLPIAAIEHDGGRDVDALLRAFVEQQRRRGRRVLGLLMAPRDPAAGCRTEMVLNDVDRGDSYLVSQSLGAGSASCSADPQGFARASQVLREALERDPDLVVCDRFGSLEAENGGFVAELLALMERGIPVLTVVAPRHFGAWERFVGTAARLPAEPSAWAAWLEAVRPRREVPAGGER